MTPRPANGVLRLAALFLLLWKPTPGAAGPADKLNRVIRAGCDEAFISERVSAVFPGAAAGAEEQLDMRGAVIGSRKSYELPDGGEVRIERIAPGGQLRRLTVEYWSPAPSGNVRPRIALLLDGACRIRDARRLLYEAGSTQPVEIELLNGNLAPTGVREPLNPPVPEGSDPGGVPVALVDSGVNYLLPEVRYRLAREGDGSILGYDYWDRDARPFDANPAHSPFFPQRHGTRTASLLLREAPGAKLVPYRYPRPDMHRMTDLVRDAAAAGVVVMNISMGSNDRGEWEAFAEAAAAHPDMLFVLSAGNAGRDIDRSPVYPAALPLDNALTVTSSEGDGSLAPGSNHGARAVDLMVPAERVPVIDFDGRPVPASGSSYAAVRISALAMRFLAANPGWRAPELKAAILARVLTPLSGVDAGAAGGFIPRPDKAERLPPMSDDGEITETARHTMKLPAYPESAGPTHLLKPTFVFFESTAWSLDPLERHAKQAASILAQCGVFMPEADFRLLSAPPAHRYFHEAIARDLVQRYPTPRPAVFFVRDTLQTDAYDAEAIGRRNSAGRPSLRDTVWMTEDTRDPGVALAHELAHVLMDNGRHVEAPGNLMRSETTPDNTKLTPQQCETMVTMGADNGLLTPATEP